MDNIDTINGISDVVPMQDWFNEWHAKNTSLKVRSVFKNKGMSGKRLTTNPPFGYMKNPDNKKEWLIDEEAAKVVRRIFSLCVEGFGPTQIAKRLKSDKVLTPTEYWDSIGRNCSKPPAAKYGWCADTVANILSKQEYIREKVVMETVLESMRRILINVQAFEKEFARKQMECYSEDKKKELAEKRRELNKAKKRITEIDGLIQKLYEDNAIGKISDERYATMALSYEEEQQELKDALPEMQKYLETETDKTESLQKFIDKVKRITQIKELTPELVHEFIDKIVVYAPRYLDGKRVQIMDIYYNGVGILRELTPEEMEEAFQKHIAKRKEKTA